jgi:ankyrin repeat protein
LGNTHLLLLLADAVHNLLELGANATARKAGSQDSPAHLAAAAGRLDMLAMLQLYADDDNAMTATNAAGISPLMVLAASGQLEHWLELCSITEATAATLSCWM